MSTIRSWMKVGILSFMGLAGAELAASPFPCLFALVQTLDDGGDLVAAVAAARADYASTQTKPEIHLNKGTYKTESEMLLNFPIVIRGTTGNPADVIIEAQAVKNTAIYRVFTINHANAWVEGVTISGGRLIHYAPSNYYNYGAGFRIAAPSSATQPDHSAAGAGGVVTNCIVSGNVSEGGYTGAAAVYMKNASGSKGVVTHCVITGNFGYRQLNQNFATTDSVRGGVLQVLNNSRVSNSLIANNIVIAKDLGGTPSCEAAVLATSGSGTIENCTVCSNRIGTCYNPALVHATGTSKIVNTLFVGNVIEDCAKRIADWDSVRYYWSGDSANYLNCGMTTADYLPNDSCVEVSAADVFDITGTDCRLTRASVLRDKGTVSGITIEGTDVVGNLRQTDSSKIDIGAYAYDPTARKIVAGELPAECWDADPVTVALDQVEGFGDEPTFYWSFADDGSVEPENITKTSSHAMLIPKGTRMVSVLVSNLVTGVGTTVILGQITSRQKLYYAKAGNAGAAAPYDSEATAAADIQTAIDAAPVGTEVVICPGTYEITTSLFILKRITVRGQTGNAEDVIVRNVYSGSFGAPDNTGHGRCCLMDADPAAKLASVVLENANVGGTYTLCGALYIGKNITGDGARANWFKAGNGGCVSNVVIRNAANGNKFGHATALCAVGSNALVTHCTITNNTSAAGYVNGATQSAFVELETGACMEHSLVAFNAVRKGSVGEPQGRLQSAVSLRGTSKVRFCTIANNQCSMVGGVNVCQSSTARVEYCVIGGNDAYESVGYYTDPTTRHHDWGFFNLSRDNDVFGGTTTKLGQDKMAEGIAAEIAYVDENPDVVNAVFVGNITDHAAAGTSGAVASLGDIYLGLGGRNVRLRAKSSARECVAVDAAGAMPVLDLQGQPRLYGEKYDVGCYEGQSVPGILMIVR